MTKQVLGLLVFLSICGTGLSDGGGQPRPVHAQKEIPCNYNDLENISSISEDDPLPRLREVGQPPPAATPPLPTLPPLLPTQRYVGLIQNLSQYDISIPAANSDATLIVPAQGWLEYIAWQPEVRLFGFVDGKQVYFQRLRVRPRAYHYMGNTYDFVATIQPLPPAAAPPACPPKATKRRSS